MNRNNPSPYRRLWLLTPVLVAAGLIALSLPTTTQAEEEAPPAADSPKVIAIKLHADWCGSCKAMGPVFTDLANKFDTAPALFVTFDMTTQSQRKQAEYHAAALGVGDLWPAYGKKTGLILLIDTQDRKVVGTLNKTHDIKQMGAALKQAIENAS